MEKEKLLILDGNSLMFRAFYALPLLTNNEGLHTNAVYGFSTMLLKMKEEIKPDYIVAAFDRKAPTFRHIEYKDYKAGRKKMPPELSEQMPVVKELLNLLAINIFEIDGFEADDLIGTLSKFAEKKGIEVYIVTGDRDALQLASDNIHIVINKKGMTEKEVYDEDRMVKELGVTPTQFIDVKALMGDNSDNIPGVPGIGPKTAFKLISEYKSIENVFENIDKLKGKMKSNLIEYREQAFFSKKLATIVTNVPIEIDLNSIESRDDFDAEGVRQLFYKLQFNSLLEKIPELRKDQTAEDIKVEYKIIDKIDELKKLKDYIKDIIFVSFNVTDANVFSKSIIEKIYLNSEKNNFVIYIKDILDEDKDSALEILRSIFENDEIEKVCHDVKVPMTVFRKFGINFKGLRFDTCVAAYLLNPSRGHYELTYVLQQYLGMDISKDEDEAAVKENAALTKLYDVLSEKIKKAGMEKLFYSVEQPLIEVLSSMEMSGFKVDKNMLEETGKKFKAEIDKTQKEIYEMADENFNINSPKQLGKILFEKLDLPVIKKTKTGYSTNAEVLEKLSDKHPIIDKIVYYRQLAKLYSTYVEGLDAVIDTDKKIHSSFNQTVTATGRLSSTEPNLQNIPVKYEMGKEIRKVFIPDSDDCILLSADYSQIELRVLAHISGDENLINAFKNNMDIHTKTASEVFRVPVSDVTKAMRSSAKAVNFEIIYGIGDFSLAKNINVSRKEARSYIDTYFERYPKVKEYMDGIVEKAKKECFVTTILGRRRYIPEINDHNKIVRSFGERLAMNSPIQGSAADIIKLAMVNVYKALKDNNLKSTLILQVHDELILNVYKNEADKVKEIVKKGMENVMELSVPLIVDINTGDNWYDAK